MNNPIAGKFEGYCLNDITYCVNPKTNDFFPVRVVKVGRGFFDVTAINDRLALAIAPEFNSERKNRRFVRPKLPNKSRFGGFDERTVNTERVSGDELRILPFHYWTYTGNAIIERHAGDAENWPIPTGIVYERWFKQALESMP
jgi:hypothetical protein